MLSSPNRIPTISVRTSCADRHDQLGWVAGAVYQASFGLLGIRSNDKRALAEVQKRVQAVPLQEASEPVPRVDRLLSLRAGPSTKSRQFRSFHVVYDAWNPVYRSLELQDVTSRLVYAVNRALALQPTWLRVPGRALKVGSEGLVVLGEHSEVAGFLESFEGPVKDSHIEFTIDDADQVRVFGQPWEKIFVPHEIGGPAWPVRKGFILSDEPGENFVEIGSAEAVARALAYANHFWDVGFAMKTLIRWAQGVTCYRVPAGHTLSMEAAVSLKGSACPPVKLGGVR